MRDEFLTPPLDDDCYPLHGEIQIGYHLDILEVTTDDGRHVGPQPDVVDEAVDELRDSYGTNYSAEFRVDDPDSYEVLDVWHSPPELPDPYEGCSRREVAYDFLTDPQILLAVLQGILVGLLVWVLSS